MIATAITLHKVANDSGTGSCGDWMGLIPLKRPSSTSPRRPGSSSALTAAMPISRAGPVETVLQSNGAAKWWCLVTVLPSGTTD